MNTPSSINVLKCTALIAVFLGSMWISANAQVCTGQPKCTPNTPCRPAGCGQGGWDNIVAPSPAKMCVQQSQQSTCTQQQVNCTYTLELYSQQPCTGRRLSSQAVNVNVSGC